MKEAHRKVLTELTVELAEKRAEFELQKKNPKKALLISIFTITITSIAAVSFLSYQNSSLQEANQSLKSRYLKVSHEWPNPLCNDEIITTMEGEPACPI